MSIFKGSGVAIITPFNENGIDFEKFKYLIEWHIKESTDAIIVCGTTGEATTMTEQEKKEAIKFTVDTVNKRIPVIAGTGGNNTKTSIEMSLYAESVGVDGLLVITPYYNKTNSEGLFMHFKAINDAVKTPIILYNVPSRTNMNITPTTLLRLTQLNNVVAIKEASGDLSQVAKMKALCGDKIDIYSGNDDQIVPIMSLTGDANLFLAVNIPGTIITVILKGALAGAAAGFVYKLISKKNQIAAVIVSALVAPVVNTGIFVLGSYVFFFDYLSGLAEGTNLFVFILVGLVGINFFIELGINLVLNPAILQIIRIGKKNFGGKNQIIKTK